MIKSLTKAANQSCVLQDLGRHIRRPTDELAEMRVDGAVTFAGAVLQRLYIKHVDATTTIADQTRLLQFAGYKGDASSALKMMVSRGIVTRLRCGKIRFRSVSDSDSKK